MEFRKLLHNLKPCIPASTTQNIDKTIQHYSQEVKFQFKSYKIEILNMNIKQLYLYLICHLV